MYFRNDSGSLICKVPAMHMCIKLEVYYLCLICFVLHTAAVTRYINTSSLSATFTDLPGLRRQAKLLLCYWVPSGGSKT